MSYPEGLLKTRAVIRPGEYAVIPPEGRVRNVIPGIEGCNMSIIASPKLGASFVQYVGTALPGGGTVAPFAQEPGVATWSPEKVKESLFKRFYISYVENVKAEHVKLTRNNGYNLTVKYEVRKPLLYNLDFVAKFEKTVELTRTDSVD